MTNEPVTLARRLGTTAHPSLLLMKARRLGIPLPSGLDDLAVARGCSYYRPNAEEVLPPDVTEEQFTNEELAVALLNNSLPFSARNIRLAACLLGGEDIDPESVAELAVEERCTPAVRYIAECGQKFDPQVPFWPRLISLLQDCPRGLVIAPDDLPHPTRFIEMTGLSRAGVGLITKWIRPHQVVR